MAWEEALVLGLLGSAFYFIYFADRFKPEGDTQMRAFVNGTFNILLKMFSVVCIIFMTFFLHFIIEAQTFTVGTTVNVLNMLDVYNMVLFWGFGFIFFIIFGFFQFYSMIRDAIKTSKFKDD